MVVDRLWLSVLGGGNVVYLGGPAGNSQSTTRSKCLHEVLDPTLEIDVVAGAPRPIGTAPVLSNSFGFGGHNVSLVLGPPG